MAKNLKANGAVATAPISSALAQPKKGGQDEWTIMNNKKRKNY